MTTRTLPTRVAVAGEHVAVLNNWLADQANAPATPLLDAYTANMRGDYDLGRDTRFVTRDTISAELVGSHNNVVHTIVLVVYGQFDFRDRTDSGAKVEVRLNRQPDGPTMWARTQSSAWTGSEFKAMPDGASARVADTVAQNMGVDPDRFDDLVDEIRLRDLWRDLASKVRDADRTLSSAVIAAEAVEAARAQVSA
jgi:hypothetical protein